MAIAALFIIAGSCIDYTVITVVHRDGSVYRRYEVRGDSAQVFKGSLKIPSGKDWLVKHELTYKDKGDTTSEKSQYMYTASHTFKNSAALNAWMADDTAKSRIRPVVKVEKRFRWFYTYYHYAETYPMTWPFRTIPVDSFLTDIEQAVAIDDGLTVYSPTEKTMIWKEGGELALTPADSAAMNAIHDSCDGKMQRWMVATMAQYYIDLVDSAFGKEPAVKMLAGKSSQFSEAILHKFNHLFDDSITTGALTVLADSVTGSGRFMELYRENPATFTPFNDRLEETGIIMTDDSYTHRLSMPGKVFATNAREVHAKMLSWEIESDYFLMKPYVLQASSRIANPWIMVVTAVVAVALIGLFFVRTKRA